MKLFRRLLHTFPEAPEFAVRNIVHGAPVIDPRAVSKPHFQTLGLGSVLEVELPSSVELVAKRNSLVGVLGANAGTSFLTSRLLLARSPLASLLGRQPLLHQSIVGSSPLTVLVGAANRHLNSLELDGSVDWVVKSPIVAHTGKQLYISPHTGWALRSAAPFSHTLVSGRGLLAWATPASPVQITVPEGESVLVAKRHLSAYTVDTNASFRRAELKALDFEFKAPVIDDVAAVEPATAAQRFKKAAVDWLAGLKTKLSWLLSVGNTGQFVEIYGPSTVLVSSAARHLRKASPKNS